MQTENRLLNLESQDEASPNERPAKPTRQDILSAIRDQIGDWDSWSKATQKANQGKAPLRKLLSKNALFWGMPTSDVIYQPVIARLLSLKLRSSKAEVGFDYGEAAASWIRSIDEAPTIANALEAVAWAYALPRLTKRLGQTAWTELLAHLLWFSDSHATETDGQAAVKFLIGVELKMALAYSTSELTLCKAARRQAKDSFAEIMDEVLDGEGTPDAKHITDIQYLLASCTRCLTLDAESKKSSVKKSARLQFDWLLRQTLRWSRANGAPILSDNLDSPFFDELLKFALKITQDDADASAFRQLRGKPVPESPVAPGTSEHSEWSELATMRTNWSAQAIRLAVDYSERSLNIELSSGNETILRGASEPRVVVNEELLSLDSDWEEVCWETDTDLDYLELECTLTRGWRLQRQFLLARNDKFAIIADAIMGPEKSQIQYQHTLPTTENITVEQEPENTEAVILGERKLGRILPLALSEWKSSQRIDRLRQEPVRLEMSASAVAMYAPLFIDLDPARRNKALTWRQLTVAEDLLSVSKDVAVAYRVQVGKAQWLIYRTLGATGNRTFLGQNMISDFYVARFMPNGETQMLLDVQPN